MGGTVKLISNQPDLTGFHASVQTILSGTDGGGFNHNVNFMLNLPLINDQIGAAYRRVGGAYQRLDRSHRRRSVPAADQRRRDPG
jgi:iron complex outermembrane recepter protein